MLVTKFHRCKTITSSPPKLSTALMWSRNMMAEQWALVCCCSVVFALLNLKFHIIVDDYGKSCYYWLCGMQIAGLNSIQDAVLTTSVSQPFSKENQRKKIFSEMKINLIRSWNKYVIPNSRPFVIQLCNYSVFLKGIGISQDNILLSINDFLITYTFVFIHCVSFIYFQNILLHFLFSSLLITLVKI